MIIASKDLARPALYCFSTQEYNKEVKGFVYCLEGSSQTVKMQMPESVKMPRESPPYKPSFEKFVLLLSEKNKKAIHLFSSSFFLSWACAKVLGPSSEYSRVQRLLHWAGVSVVIFYIPVPYICQFTLNTDHLWEHMPFRKDNSTLRLMKQALDRLNSELACFPV